MAKKAVVESETKAAEVPVVVTGPAQVFVRKGRSMTKELMPDPLRKWGMLCELLEGVAAECQQRNVMPGAIVVTKKEERWDEWLEAEVRG